ncbi:MAG TPA: hypothetical protein VEH04_11420 [Verrucomicrobiae bacterium]|nr:hypothetical protein [Verrucomicrobiae bacterium]
MKSQPAYDHGFPIAISCQDGGDRIDPAEAIRFLDDQAKLCRDRDDHEALCLLLPALMKVLQLAPMNGYEAADFRRRFKQQLQNPTGGEH